MKLKIRPQISPIDADKNPSASAPSAEASPLPCFIRELRDAIRRGLKTETRRVLKPQPTDNIPDEFKQWCLFGNELSLADKRDGDELGPDAGLTTKEEWSLTQANIGALYYLREPVKNVNGWMFYADDDEPVSTPKGAREWKRIDGQKLKRNTLPQIHMPAEAARTYVRLTKVWTERLHNITEAGAIAEGCCGIANTRFGTPNFRYLWDTINATRDGGKWAWAKNPFVIVRQFRLVAPEQSGGGQLEK